MNPTYLIVGTVVVVLVFAVFALASHQVSYREEEMRGAEDWLERQLRIYPIRPLKEEHVATVKSTMSSDHDLWCLLNIDDGDEADRYAWYQAVIK